MKWQNPLTDPLGFAAQVIGAAAAIIALPYTASRARKAQRENW